MSQTDASKQIKTHWTSKFVGSHTRTLWSFQDHLTFPGVTLRRVFLAVGMLVLRLQHQPWKLGTYFCWKCWQEIMCFGFLCDIGLVWHSFIHEIIFHRWFAVQRSASGSGWYSQGAVASGRNSGWSEKPRRKDPTLLRNAAAARRARILIAMWRCCVVFHDLVSCHSFSWITNKLQGGVYGLLHFNGHRSGAVRNTVDSEQVV